MVYGINKNIFSPVGTNLYTDIYIVRKVFEMPFMWYPYCLCTCKKSRYRTDVDGQTDISLLSPLYKYFHSFYVI